MIKMQEPNYYVITAVLYFLTNFIMPSLAIGAAHYGTKKQFWLDVIVPFRIVAVAIISFVKFMIQNFKEHYPKLK